MHNMQTYIGLNRQLMNNRCRLSYSG